MKQIQFYISYQGNGTMLYDPNDKTANWGAAKTIWYQVPFKKIRKYWYYVGIL